MNAEFTKSLLFLKRRREQGHVWYNEFITQVRSAARHKEISEGDAEAICELFFGKTDPDIDPTDHAQQVRILKIRRAIREA